jgi:hypothetical protein
LPAGANRKKNFGKNEWKTDVTVFCRWLLGNKLPLDAKSLLTGELLGGSMPMENRFLTQTGEPRYSGTALTKAAMPARMASGSECQRCVFVAPCLIDRCGHGLISHATSISRFHGALLMAAAGRIVRHAERHGQKLAFPQSWHL